MVHSASGVRCMPGAVSCKSHWTSSPSLKKSDLASHHKCLQYVRLDLAFLRSNRTTFLSDRAADSHPFVPSGRGMSLGDILQAVAHYTIHRGGHPIRPAAQTRSLAMTPDGSVLSAMRARRMFRFGYSCSSSVERRTAGSGRSSAGWPATGRRACRSGFSSHGVSRTLTYEENVYGSIRTSLAFNVLANSSDTGEPVSTNSTCSELELRSRGMLIVRSPDALTRPVPSQMRQIGPTGVCESRSLATCPS